MKARSDAAKPTWGLKHRGRWGLNPPGADQRLVVDELGWVGGFPFPVLRWVGVRQRQEKFTCWFFSFSPCLPLLLAATSNSSCQHSIRPAFTFLQLVISHENVKASCNANKNHLWEIKNDLVKVLFERRFRLEGPGNVGRGVEVTFGLTRRPLFYACIWDYLLNLLLSIAVDEVSGNYVLLVNLVTACDCVSSWCLQPSTICRQNPRWRPWSCRQVDPGKIQVPQRSVCTATPIVSVNLGWNNNKIW